MMKKIFYWAMMAGVVLASCSKSEEIVSPEEEQVVNIKVKRAGVYTKNSDGDNGIDDNDNKINTLEIFLFKSNGALESYKKYTAAEITAAGGLSNLEVKSTVGEKNIYVIANSKVTDWIGFIDEEHFLERECNLSDEDFQNFTMSGSTTATISGAGSVEVTIARLVARIVVTGIRTSFYGTPYEGQSLRDVKLYLTNVHGQKNFLGSGFASPLILNNAGYVAGDNSDLTIDDMLYESVASSIGDSGNDDAHYFYCYENLTSEETATEKYTRLILEGKINGVKYYYPVDINQVGYGWVSANEHYGVKRNTSYSFDFTIAGPGALTPDDKLVSYTLTVNTSVAGWSSANDYSVSF